MRVPVYSRHAEDDSLPCFRCVPAGAGANHAAAKGAVEQSLFGLDDTVQPGAPRHGAKDLVHSTLRRGHAAFEDDVSFFIQNTVAARTIPQIHADGLFPHPAS